MLKKNKKLLHKKPILAASLFLCAMLLTTSALATTFTQNQTTPEELTNQENQPMTQPRAQETTNETDTQNTGEATAKKNDEMVVADTAATPVSTQASKSAAAPGSVKQSLAGTPSPVVKPLPVSTTQVDEHFNGESLDTALWEAISYPKGYRNNEEQDYRPSQVRVADGTLQLTATKDAGGEWHSGEVHSKWNYLYGEFEVRMALSTTGPGVWPAAWLMGSTGHWPTSGEIDIMENINGNATVYGTLHGGGGYGHWQLQRSYSPVNITEYHTYKIIKHPGLISWWVDGVKRGEWTQSQTPAGGTWPFESYRNFGLLNLAIGGNWPGPSNDSTPSSITMYVDYFTVKNAS